MNNDNRSQTTLQVFPCKYFKDLLDPLGFLNPENYLTGAEAERVHNRMLFDAHQRIGNLTYHDWLITDGIRETKIFYRGRIGDDGIWRGHRTKLKGNKRIEKGPELTGDDIRAITADQGNGVWYYPRAPFLLPLADSCHDTNLITAEWDTQDPDPSNWGWLKVLTRFTELGMPPNSITASGGKCRGFSPHAQWLFNQTLNTQEIKYIQEQCLTLLGADPAPMQKRMSQFRKPGFYRHSKGNEQGLFKTTYETTYDLKDWVNTAIAIGKELGIEIPSPQEWAKQQAELAEKNSASAPDDLTGIPEADIDRLLTEIDRQCPPYSPGNNTYPYRMKLAGAIYTLVGDRGDALCPNILTGASFGSLRRNNHPIGTIVNQTRLLLGNPEWQLPDWWKQTQQTNALDQLWGNWLKTKEFKAAIKLDQRFFDFKDFKDGFMYFIKAGLGGGKTFNTRQWIEDNREWLIHNRVFFLGYRNNLLLQECEKTEGLIHIHQFGQYDFISDPELWAAYCLDSIPKFKPEDFDGAVIVLDEIISVIKHLLFAQTEIAKYRDKAILLFIEAIKRARLVICLDGNMADWAVAFMAGICPDKKTQTIGNIYQTPRPDLYWLKGGINSQGELSPNDYNPLIDKIINSQSTGAIAIASDSQTSLETLDSLLTSNGKITFRVDAKTSGTAEVKQLLANSTEFLTANKIDVLLISPTGESGVDISITGYFTAHYCLFFGVLDVDSSLQMMARIRDVNCPKYLWAREWSNSQDDFKSPTVEVLTRVTNERLNLDLNRVLSGEIDGAKIISEILETYQRPLKIVETTAFRIHAQRNFERGHFRECLRERAAATGYPITDIEPEMISQDIKETYSEERETVLRNESAEIFKAVVKPVNSLNPDKLDDQRSLKKIKLLDQLPGIDNDPIWSDDFVFTVLFKDRRVLTQARRAWMLDHPEVYQRLERESFKRKHDRYFDGGHSLIWLDRNEWGKLWALSECGIGAIINHPDPNKRWRETDPEIQYVIQQCKRKAIYLDLGFRQGKREPMQYVGRLLGLTGGKWKGKRVRLDDDSLIREYRLDRKHQERPEWIAIQRSLDRKWWKYTDTELAPIDWSPPPSYCENTAENAPEFYDDDQPPQTHTGQGFEVVPPPPSCGIVSKGLGGTENVPEKTEIKDSIKIEYITHQTSAGDNVVILNPETLDKLEWDDFISHTDRAIERLGWSVEQSKRFLIDRYGKKSRLQLTDEQVFDLWLTLYNLTLSLNHNLDTIRA